MLNRIISWSLEHRFLVLVLAAIVAAAGIVALSRLPVDAFPDTTPVQVQINTAVPALSAEEVEQQVTFAVEQAIAGLPGLSGVRSISKLGLSQVTVVFSGETDLWLARQLVLERLDTVELPEGAPPPEMGPISTGLGEVYHYIVTGEGKSLEELTTLHDWVIKPRLRSIPGVAEVNTWGGERKEYHVVVDLDRLVRHGLTLDDVFDALRSNNRNVGGGFVARAGELQTIRGIGIVTDVDSIASIVITAHEGVPIRIGDVARVETSHEIRRGAVTANGKGEVVLGLGFMLLGENSRAVTERLDERRREIQRDLDAANAGVEIRPVYSRTELVDDVLSTVRENLFEGAILVVAVLFLFLGNLRAGLIVASAIPLSMLFAANGMLELGIAGSLMSLGAIDFGLIVDSSVIQVENAERKLEEANGDRPVIDVVREAALEVRKPTMFGELIIMVVYLPILTLEGVEGDLFRPMAITVILALLGSLILSLTVMPALASLVLRPRRRARENPIVRAATWLYRPVVRLAMRGRALFIGTAIGLLALGLWLSTTLGSEFVPRLSEMGIVINTVRLSGVSLEESVRVNGKIEEIIREEFPAEVRDVWTRTGTAEVATDPMGIEVSDIFLTLHPRERWKRARTQDELTDAIRAELEGMPGMRMIFTQPIEMRMNEMVAGIRADLGVKIFGDDLDVLEEKAAEVEAILRSIPGSADLYTEQITGQPVLAIEVDRDQVARFGVPADHVLEIVEAMGGTKLGDVREGQRRFDLVARLDERFRDDPYAIRNILVPTASGERIPLARLAQIREIEGPSTITREWQKRRIVVQTNVRGRDIASFVEEARTRIAAELELPPSYHVEYGGQFEHLERARARLLVVVPLALVLILLLLHGSTGSIRDTLLIFTGAPFAALGGVVALWVRDMPFTISAGVGFVAVSGVAMLNGLVLASTFRDLRGRGVPLSQAIEESAILRLRPVLMTALVASLGFVPMALNTGVGAEIQRPLATVVIGGVVSDALLTLLVLPALFAVFCGRERAGGEAIGKSS